ncbi:MAG: NAD-dependent epimerase/dehydratase family protein [Vulcanimicrobiaceae bacterium]
MRIIVTGGAGFIGSHIVDRYLELGHEVLVVDNLWSHGGGRRENVPARAAFAQVDIRDDELSHLFLKFKPEVVCHHAAQHSVAIGSRDPKYDAQVNVLGFLNVLEAASKAEARKVVYASSGATYGTPEHLPMDERTPQLPESPYGITKMVGEHYLRFYKNERGLDFTSLRYANVYGPRQDPNGEAGVIAIFAGRFLSKSGVRIDWDGEQTRDYVFVEDVARCNVLALDRGSGGCYAVGTGIRTSVNQLYHALVEISGFTAPIEHAPKRQGDVRDAQFDASLAKRELGWEPQVALLDGMRTTYEYFRDRSASRV